MKNVSRASDLSDPYYESRQQMVDCQIANRGVTDERVLQAIRYVPRHLFVPPNEIPHAYLDKALPIGFHQTISQPYIVAYMSALLEIKGSEKVLEIGSGSGYQTALLAQMGCTVYSLELIPALSQRAHDVLRSLKYEKTHLRVGSGYLGWKEEAPFDRIIVTAAAPYVPPHLTAQLASQGRMVIPVDADDSYQILQCITKTGDGTLQTKKTIPVCFVPLV
jgi:protein-L-isoaspartate(D-aspartate) O-methyltransferase